MMSTYRDLFLPVFGRSKSDTIQAIFTLRKMHASGRLGGEIMPEDVNPGLPITSEQNALFFTLPMALNYQRNSYALWPSATKCFQDPDTRFVFDPLSVIHYGKDRLRAALVGHKVALQPNKHVEIWYAICEALTLLSDSSVRKLLETCHYSVAELKTFVQLEHKRSFPYLSGEKIFNYWLYVLEQYAAVRFVDRHLITIAPDTHVIQATVRLGLLDESVINSPNVRALVAEAWRLLLKESDLTPIDVHTPLWLWSRKGFPDIID